jgi:UDPglucose 6-dehydrogenase
MTASSSASCTRCARHCGRSRVSARACWDWHLKAVRTTCGSRRRPAIIESLVAEGCEIQAYDPAAGQRAREVLGTKGVRYVDSVYAAAENADALLLLAEWEEFRSIDLARVRELLHYPIVIDGRNLFDPETMREHGFLYLSVGRPDVRLKEEKVQGTAAADQA